LAQVILAQYCLPAVLQKRWSSNRNSVHLTRPLRLSDHPGALSMGSLSLKVIGVLVLSTCVNTTDTCPGSVEQASIDADKLALLQVHAHTQSGTNRSQLQTHGQSGTNRSQLQTHGQSGTNQSQLQSHAKSGNLDLDAVRPTGPPSPTLATFFDTFDFYVTSPAGLWREGAFFFELCFRINFVLSLVHAYRHGYIFWTLVMFCVGIYVEVRNVIPLGYCKADSLFMFSHCNEISLHASFWTFWLYPCVLSAYRLNLNSVARICLTGMMTCFNGVIFDLTGPAIGLWRFNYQQLNNPGTMLLGCTLFPYGYWIHLTAGLGDACLLELLMHTFSEPEIDPEYGYPKMTVIQQILLASASFGFAYFLTNFILQVVLQQSLVAAWVASILIWIFMVTAVVHGVRTRKTPTLKRKDWLLFSIPLISLGCYITHYAWHMVTGYYIEFNIPFDYTLVEYTPGDEWLGFAISVMCVILGLSGFSWILLTIPEQPGPDTEKLKSVEQ